jgi:hypothetical protein
MSILSELQAIYDQHGELTPQLVVREAKRPDHPLHKRFDWDDSKAARKWRLHQASSLIRSVNVVIERGDDSPPIRVRAFVSENEISRGKEDGQVDDGSYLPVERVVSDDVMRTAWFRSLQRDWERLKAKAGASREFAQMVVSDMRGIAS